MEKKNIIKKYEEIMAEANKELVESRLGIKKAEEKMEEIKKKAEKNIAKLSQEIKKC